MGTFQVPPRLSGSRLRKARLATFVGFFQLGVIVFSWSTGTSPLRTHLGLTGAGGDSQFGLIALGIGVGAALGSILIGPVIDRFGARKVVSVALVLFPLAIVPLAYLGGISAAIVAGTVLGLCRGAVDTAINAHGVQVERHYGRPIMSAFHAAFPAGGFIAGLLGSALARHYTDSPAVAFTSMGLAMAVAGLLCRPWLLSNDEVLPAHEVATAAPGVSTRAKRTTAVLLLMIGFGVLLLASMLSEESVIDWGQEFVRREVGTTTAVAGLAVTLYSGAQFAGRLVGDRLAQRFGASRVVGISALLAVLGTSTIMLSGNTAVAMVGFGLLGLGLAVVAPLMLSSAGRADPLNAGRNLGLVNALGYAGMLAGPAAITLVVDTAGLRWMPLLPCVLMFLVLIGGPLLMRFTPSHEQPQRSTDHGESLEELSSTS